MASLCVAGTLGGCSLSMLFIESLTKSDTNVMHLVSLGTFILVPLYCVILKPKVLSERKVPFNEYGIIVLLFFMTNILNNQSVNYDIPFPLYIIFRSGTLMASMLLQAIILRRTYPWEKILAVFSVTFGIVLFTWVSSDYQPQTRIEHLWIDVLPWPRFATGIMAQTMCIFISAYLGIRQQAIFGTYGTCPDEMMFYVHIFSLPLFLPISPSIFETVKAFGRHGDVSHFVGLHIPTTWIKLLLVCVFQIICIRSVYNLTSVVSSLTVNLVLSLRKFLNLFLSVYIFENELSNYHWLAAMMIIGGACAYCNAFTQVKEAILGVGRKHKKVA